MLDTDLWYGFEGGQTLGLRGAEDGTITRDEEHQLGARITIERGGPSAPYSIICGIYGWTFHTRFFNTEAEAIVAFEQMKTSLSEILAIIPAVDDPELERKRRVVSDAITAFVTEYP